MMPKLQVSSNFDGCIHLRGNNFFLIQFKLVYHIICYDKLLSISTRFLYHLKKKVKNKARVEASICNAYIVEEVTIFASCYFEPHVLCKRRRAGRNDEGSIDHNCKAFSIFNYLDRSSGACQFRYLTGKEFHATHIYILLNCLEVKPYFK